MYGPRGSTVPPKYLANYNNRNYTQNRNIKYNNNNHHRKTSNSLPITKQFWCETCDRSFRSHDQFEDHKAEHQVCGIDGCKFVAHTSVLKSHREMQHQNGLYAKLIKLETPEDIEKWRTERKKRYPTTANVQLRQLMQEEKLFRGERLNDSQSRFGKKRQRNPMPSNDNRSNTPNSKKRKRSNYSKNKFPKPPTTEIVTGPIIADNGDEPDEHMRFRGTELLEDYKRVEAKAQNNLTLLMGMYGSDSDEDSVDTESDNEISEPLSVCMFHNADEKAKSKHEAVVDKSNDLMEDGEIEDSEKDEKDIKCDEEPSTSLSEVKSLDVQSIVRTNDTGKNTGGPKNKRKRKRRKNNNKELHTPANETTSILRRQPSINFARLAKAPPNTFLAKLLQPEIRHERNVLLQCVRFVVRNRFFGIGAENRDTVGNTVSKVSQNSGKPEVTCENIQNQTDISDAIPCKSDVPSLSIAPGSINNTGPTNPSEIHCVNQDNKNDKIPILQTDLHLEPE